MHNRAVRRNIRNFLLRRINVTEHSVLQLLRLIDVIHKAFAVVLQIVNLFFNNVPCSIVNHFEF
jgi:hypothetical protein